MDKAKLEGEYKWLKTAYDRALELSSERLQGWNDSQARLKGVSEELQASIAKLNGRIKELEDQLLAKDEQLKEVWYFYNKEVAWSRLAKQDRFLQVRQLEKEIASLKREVASWKGALTDSQSTRLVCQNTWAGGEE